MKKMQHKDIPDCGYYSNLFFDCPKCDKGVMAIVDMQKIIDFTSITYKLFCSECGFTGSIKVTAISGFYACESRIAT